MQQMHPLFNSIISSAVFIINSLSIPISPNSLTKTAVLIPTWFFKMWFKSVVLPEPKNPLIIVIGSKFSAILMVILKLI